MTKRKHKPSGFSAVRLFTESEIKQLQSLYRYDPKTGKITDNKGRKVGSPCNRYLQVKTVLGCIYAHRLAWILYYGKNPTKTIDHINRCKTDNRISNLRLATMKEQMQNYKKRKLEKTPIHGINVVVGTSIFTTGYCHVQHDFKSIDDAVVFRLRHNLTI